MECQNKVNNHLCFFGNQREWISPVISLVPLLIFVGYFLGFGFFSPIILLTSTILILSTTLFTLPCKLIKLAPKDQDIPEQKIPFQNSEEKQPDHENKITSVQTQTPEEEEEEEEEEVTSSSPDSQDSLSESECMDFSDDGSISDEEGLIEIALPSGHVDDQKKMPADLFPQCIFKQRSLMELLAEINEIIIEEDNLIEIDLSIGSIKCSRFEIEA